MGRRAWTRGDLLRAIIFIPPASYAALGLLGHWHGWRDEWAFAGWAIMGLAGLVWRDPRALVVPAATALASAVAAASRTWPEDPGRLVLPGAVIGFAVTALGIAAGLGLAALYGVLRGGRVARPGRRQVLAEVANLAILLVAVFPLAYPLDHAPGPALLILGLAAALLAIVGLAAVRQPRHCWLLAFETALAFLIPLLIGTIWFAPARPPGLEEPLSGIVFESLLIVVPFAWVAALLGKWLGGLVRRARGHPGDRPPAVPAYP